MKMFLLFSFTILVLSSTVSFAHKQNRYIDTISHQKVTIITRKIGDADYHRFGDVTMMQEGSNCSITFPVFTFTERFKSTTYEDADIMPAGTEMVLSLDDGTIITSATAQDTKVMWYYWFHQYPRSEVDNITQPYDAYLTHHKPINTDPVARFAQKYPDRYGMSWMLTYKFTSADITALKNHLIVTASVTKNTRNIILPIRHKQAGRIKRSIAVLIS